jgi:hypothetical protein
MSFLNGPVRGRSVRMGAVLLAAVGTAGVLACAEPHQDCPLLATEGGCYQNHQNCQSCAPTACFLLA